MIGHQPRGRKVFLTIGILSLISAIVVFTIGFVDYDRSRIRQSTFIKCDVSGATRCESVLDPASLTADSGQTMWPLVSMGRFARSFVKVGDRVIYDNVANYELLIRGYPSKGPLTNIERVVMDVDLFAKEGDAIEYQWYFKSRFGTIYRMFSARKPTIYPTKLESYDYLAMSLAALSLMMIFFHFGLFRFSRAD